MDQAHKPYLNLLVEKAQTLPWESLENWEIFMGDDEK